MEYAYAENNKIIQVIVCSGLFSTSLNTYILHILIWKSTQAARLEYKKGCYMHTHIHTAGGGDINSNLLNVQSEIQALVI